MTLSAVRDYIVSHVAAHQVQNRKYILQNVRRGADVIAAAQQYIKSRRILVAGMSAADLACAICNDLLRVGVIALVERGRYSNVSKHPNCFVIVRSGNPKTMRGIRSGLKWSHR